MDIGQFVHFSVDDVIRCFKWIYENRPCSIFEEPMLKKIKDWNMKYNLQCDLYVFERCEGFFIEQLQDCYWEELKKESSWLKLAWHQDEEKERYIECSSIESLERTYNLIVDKIGKNAWSNIVRLHEYSATNSLLESLKTKGIDVLLTAELKKSCYQLTDQDMEELTVHGVLDKEKFFYRNTNILLSELDNEKTVEELLEKTETSLRKFPKEQCSEICINEMQFHALIEKMEQYWEGFGKIQIPLIANAGVQVGNKIYFTTCNTNGLYVLDLESKTTSFERALPSRVNLGQKYSSIEYYRDMIWMIPWYEDDILVYDINKHEILKYSLSFLFEKKRGEPKFRKAIRDEKNLWLLPFYANFIIKIDMIELDISIIGEWAQETKRGFGAPNFRLMCQLGKKLFLIKDAYPKNLVVDMDSGEIAEWREDIPKSFTYLIDEKTILSPPLENHEPLEVLNEVTGEKEDYLLPDWVWRENREVYAFWYAKEFAGNIYILPTEARAIVIYNKYNKSIKLIDSSMTDNCTLYIHRTNPFYDIFENDEKYYTFPYMGDTMLCLKEGQIEGDIRLSIKVEDYKKVGIQFNGVFEDGNNNIDGFLREMMDCKCCNWKQIINMSMEQKSIGAKIYNKV